jgi:hypothetical protein
MSALVVMIILKPGPCEVTYAAWVTWATAGVLLLASPRRNRQT